MTVLEFRTNWKASKRICKKTDSEYCRFIFSKASKFGWKKKLNRTKLSRFCQGKNIIGKYPNNLLIEKESAYDSPKSIIEDGICISLASATSKSSSSEDIEKQFPILSSLLDEEDDWIPPSKRKNSTTLYETEDKLKNTSNLELFVQ
ncbi:unnamed protein product [Hymenolepis diminuta]|uniref:Uncharacterized protein n=1 Tax=Hymenolepis diminuta TaxID=6216 RepID=A0A564YMD5_HYMDI|nr:unnamed protein product [Hymenolepis diminuta]